MFSHKALKYVSKQMFWHLCRISDSIWTQQIRVPVRTKLSLSRLWFAASSLHLTTKPLNQIILQLSHSLNIDTIQSPLTLTTATLTLPPPGHPSPPSRLPLRVSGCHWGNFNCCWLQLVGCPGATTAVLIYSFSSIPPGELFFSSSRQTAVRNVRVFDRNSAGRSSIFGRARGPSHACM